MLTCHSFQTRFQRETAAHAERFDVSSHRLRSKRAESKTVSTREMFADTNAKSMHRERLNGRKKNGTLQCSRLSSVVDCVALVYSTHARAQENIGSPGCTNTRDLAYSHMDSSTILPQVCAYRYNDAVAATPANTITRTCVRACVRARNTTLVARFLSLSLSLCYSSDDRKDYELYCE